MNKSEPCEIIIHKGVYPGGVYVGALEDRWTGPRPPLVITAARNADGSFEEVVFDGGRKLAKFEPVPGKLGVYKTPGKYSMRTSFNIWETSTRTRYAPAADLAGCEQFPATFWFGESHIFLHTSDGRPPEGHDIGMSRDEMGIIVWRQDTTVRGLRFRNFLTAPWSTGTFLRAANTTAEDCRTSNATWGFIMGDPTSANTRVVRCRADDCAGGAYSSAKHGIVEDCRFYKIRDCFMVPENSQNDCGIQSYHPGYEGEVRRNLCVGFSFGIFMKCSVSEFVVENNTVADAIIFGAGGVGWHAKDVFRNNIVTGADRPFVFSGMLQPTSVVDYYCIWKSPNENSLQWALSDLRKSGTGAHHLVADPRFAAPSRGDYRLLPDSPCLKAGPHGEMIGALPVVGADFKDVEPPTVKLSAAKPARFVAGPGEFYLERDPWMGGAPNVQRELPYEREAWRGTATAFVKLLPPEACGGQWLTQQAKVTLDIRAEDAMSKPTQMKVRLGNTPWGEAEPFQQRKTLELPAASALTAASVMVSDAAGNWSAPKTIMLRQAAGGPQLKGKPVVYANDAGVAICYETDVLCRARIEFGTDTKYGGVFEQLKAAQRSWITDNVGNWAEILSHTRVTNYMVLLKPKVTPGKTYHYRLVLQDEVGNTTISEDAVFTVSGPAKTYFVSPQGEDAVGGGAREKPWRSIQFAVDRALPADRVILLPGFYAGEATLTHGGLEGASIAIEADQQWTAILDGRHESQTCLHLKQSPHVVINGLELRWFSDSGVKAAGSPFVTVLNCKIWNDSWRAAWCGGYGIDALQSPGLVADGNVVWRIDQAFFLLDSPRSRITRNTCAGNNFGPVSFIRSAEGSVLRNNSFAFGRLGYGIQCQDAKKEMATFQSDYNNLGTHLGGVAPAGSVIGEKRNVVIKSEFFKDFRGPSSCLIQVDNKNYGNLDAWYEATGNDRHSIYENPMYVDPERVQSRW